MARWRPTGRELAMLLAVVVAGVLVGILGYVVVDAARAREQAVRHAEAQAQVAMDARRAQTARISDLIVDVHELERQVAAHEATIAAQSQAIADLSEQVRRAGEDPITGDPAAVPDGGDASVPSTSAGGTPPTPAQPAPQPPSPPPGAAPAPSPAPSPSPEPPPGDDPVLCLPLDLLCIG